MQKVRRYSFLFEFRLLIELLIQDYFTNILFYLNKIYNCIIHAFQTIPLQYFSLSLNL